jgi:hypothetical protein
MKEDMERYGEILAQGEKFSTRRNEFKGFILQHGDYILSVLATKNDKYEGLCIS